MLEEIPRFQEWQKFTPQLGACLLAVLLVTSCEKPQKSNPEEETGISVSSVFLPNSNQQPATGVVQTPVDRAVTDKKGRSIDVRILSRTGTKVKMVRMVDNFSFEMPIKDLSESDRQFVLRIPESASAPPPSDPYVKSREESLVTLNSDLKVLQVELRTLEAASNVGGSDTSLGPSSGSQASLKRREIASVKAEIARLEGQIEIYRLKNP